MADNRFKDAPDVDDGVGAAGSLRHNRLTHATLLACGLSFAGGVKQKCGESEVGEVANRSEDGGCLNPKETTG